MITLVKMKKKEMDMNLKEKICLVVVSLEKILLSILVVAAVLIHNIFMGNRIISTKASMIFHLKKISSYTNNKMH